MPGDKMFYFMLSRINFGTQYKDTGFRSITNDMYKCAAIAFRQGVNWMIHPRLINDLVRLKDNFGCISGQSAYCLGHPSI